MLVGNKTDLITNPVMLRRLAEKREKVVTLTQIVYFLGKPGGYPTFSYSDICFEFSISDRFGWILLYKHMMEK